MPTVVNGWWTTGAGQGGTGGGAATNTGMKEIASVTTTASASTITFDLIPDNYDDLQITIRGRMAGAHGSWRVMMKLNDDGTAANYTGEVLYGEDATVGAGTSYTSTDGVQVISMPGVTGNANAVGTGVIYLNGYAGSVLYRTWQSDSYEYTSVQTRAAFAGVWKSTAAITKIVLTADTDTFTDGTTAVLYGLGGPGGAGSGTGTVTAVAAGTGLTASPSPIISTGTMSMADTAVTPGTYQAANITVDQQGRITDASDGGASITFYSGVGSPEAVVTADPGSTYYDTGGAAFYSKVYGVGNTGWVLVTSVDDFISGAGSPEGVVTAVVGTVYLNTTNLHFWQKQSGTGNTGWVDIGTTPPPSGKLKLPVKDTTNIVYGSSDSTKQARFEVDGLTTNTTRAMTIPDANGTLVLGTGTNGQLAQWTSANTLTGVAATTYYKTTQTVAGGGSTTVTFSSIPAGYSVLKVYVYGSMTSTVVSNAAVWLQINGDTTAGHYSLSIYAYASDSTTTQAGEASSINVGSKVMQMGTDKNYGSSPMSSMGEVTIIDYRNATFPHRCGGYWNFQFDSSFGEQQVGSRAFTYTELGAITDLVFTADTSGDAALKFSAGTTFTMVLM